METAPQITYRGLDASPAIDAIIREKLERLERFHERITSCRVTVEKTTAKGRKGHIFHVAVEMEVPGGVVIVNRKPGDQKAHVELNVAVRDAFDAARRQLEDHVRKLDGVHVKSHPEKRYGTVVRLFPDEGYGFIRMAGGAEVYFQRDSVVREDWEKLDLQSEVEFSLMDGEKGAFAVNVSVRG
jgi:cold shock CspA family protein/ribosome-associated translation inhibitor RaiA